MATFITNKNIGEFINIDIETSEGFWKYYHDGVWSEVYDSGTYTGSFEIEVTAEDGEFTLTSCDAEGTISGDITYLDLNNNGLTEFDGTPLTGLTQLILYSNQLTSFTGKMESHREQLREQSVFLCILDTQDLHPVQV